MIEGGKKSVLGVLVDCIDYDAAVGRILGAARQRRPLACVIQVSVLLQAPVFSLRDRAHMPGKRGTTP